MKQILYKLFEHRYLDRKEARDILQNIEIQCGYDLLSFGEERACPAGTLCKAGVLQHHSLDVISPFTAVAQKGVSV